jgi:hypothetical protein
MQGSALQMPRQHSKQGVLCVVLAAWIGFLDSAHAFLRMLTTLVAHYSALLLLDAS